MTTPIFLFLGKFEVINSVANLPGRNAKLVHIVCVSSTFAVSGSKLILT